MKSFMKTLQPVLRIVTSIIFAVNVVFPPVAFPLGIRQAYAQTQVTAEDLHEMMKKLMDPNLSALDKKKLTAIIFYHSDVYRKAVMLEQFKADSVEVKAFLEQKALMQQEVIQRMGVKYKNQYGEVLKQPIIPFSYNNIFSDDDIITGTGDIGRKLEGVYNEALNDHIKEHVGRPMTEVDRKRVDVNGLAWNMTQDAAFEDFKHHEKYINPQSGYANQEKLIEGAKNPDPNKRVVAYTFDDSGRMVALPPDETVKAIERLEVDKPMLIPGIDVQKGTGGMSDFLRMAEIHKVKFTGTVTVEEVQQFIRNQKYSQRVIGPFNTIGAKIDPDMAKEYESFIKVSDELRNKTTVRGVAEALEKEYGTKIIDTNGVIDYDKLTEAMKLHQDKQLVHALPAMLGSVMKSEAVKISEWLKSASAADRRKLRKQIAVTYAPMEDSKRLGIAEDLKSLDLPEEDVKFLTQAVDGDAKQIARYADLLEIPREDLVKRLNLEGANMAVVDFVEGKNVKVKALTEAMDSHFSGKKFKEFLKSKTAEALNLDVMLEGSPGERVMLASMLLLAASRAYYSYNDNTERWKAVAMSMFEMIPLVSASLRFSEMEYRDAFKELACDVLPPLALAQLAGVMFNYVAQTAQGSFEESVWQDLVDQALAELTDNDFEKTATGIYRLKNRSGYLEYLEDVYPGFGKVAKLASLMAPEVEGMMSRHPEVQNNEAALYTILWFEGIKYEAPQTFDPMQTVTRVAGKKFVSEVNRWLTGMKIDQLKAKVYEQGMLQKGQGSNVERVAAKIILDNLRIKAQLTEQVLEKFIDRIETVHTKKKGELSGEFDPAAIITETMAILKKDFENPPDEIKESPWGQERLKEEYVRNIGFLKDYQPQDGMEEIELRRQMQTIVDGFRAFIKKLVVAVMLYEESKSLDLRPFIYGGIKSMEPTDSVLLGDQFRAGAALRINSKRQMQKWSLHYYVVTDEGNMYLGSVALNPQDYRGGEGLWVIEENEKKAQLTIPNEHLINTFAEEGAFRILPVIAFGEWKDPAAEVGMDALINTIDHPEAFTKDKVAFAGKEMSMSVIRAEIIANVPATVYRNENAPVQVVLNIPVYAKEKECEARVKVLAPEGGPSAKASPDPLPSVSTNPDQPSVLQVTLSEGAKEGQYIVTVNVDISGLPKESQPPEQTLIFEYSKAANPAAPEGSTETSAAGIDPAFLEKMRQLEAAAAGLAEETQGLEKSIKSSQSEIIKGTERVKKDIMSIETKISNLESLANKMEQNVERSRQLADECYKSGETAAGLRSSIEQTTLKGCQEAEVIKGSYDVPQLKSSLEFVRTQCSFVQSDEGKFNAQLNSVRASKRQIDEIQKEFSTAPTKRDEVKVNLEEQANSVNELKTRLAELETQMQVISGKSQAIAGVKGEASGTVDQAKALGDPQDKEQKKILKEMEGLFSRIIKHESRLNASVEKSLASQESLAEKVSSTEQKITEVQNKFSSLPESLMGSEALAQIENSANEAGASVDAAELFEDPVKQLVVHCDSCLNASQALVAERTSPEAQVARHNCSQWPGTVAYWNSDKQIPECQCTRGNLWDENLFTCVTEEQYYMARIDCSGYLYAHPEWDGRQALCYCNQGYEWSNDRRTCRVSAQVQVAQTDCSNHPNTYPGWDAPRETVTCFCVQGFYWDGSRCVQEQAPQYNPNAGQDFVNALTGLVNTINNNSGMNNNSNNNNNNGNNSWGGNMGGGSNNSTQQGLPCEEKYYPSMGTLGMACQCDGYSWNQSLGKCVPGGGTTTSNTGGNWRNEGYQGGSNQGGGYTGGGYINSDVGTPGSACGLLGQGDC